MCAGAVVSNPQLAKALEHLENAEATILSHVAAMSAASNIEMDDEHPEAVLLTMDLPDPLPMLLAVLRSVSRAAGVLETLDEQ